tara:strand:- start:29397 stop:32954 length:3558 start_codon:yes stop_codon:yes gene_type:complete
MKPTAYSVALVLLLVGCVQSGQVTADDIDLYRVHTGNGKPVQRIVLALDLSANGLPRLCENAATLICKRELGPLIYNALDIVGQYRAGGSGVNALIRPDGVPDMQQSDPLNTQSSLAESDWPGLAVSYLDALRAALRVVVEESQLRSLATGRDSRTEVAIMLPHEQTCDGSGPYLLPGFSPSSARGCSAGAYVLSGFVDIGDDQKREQLFARLAAIPLPGTTLPWAPVPWAGHHYRAGDIYLELFRYLTGQQVFNGFLGVDDFASKLRGNLYHADQGAVRNDVLIASGARPDPQALLAPDSRSIDPTSIDLASNDIGRARYQSPVEAGESCSQLSVVNLLHDGPAPAHRETLRAIGASYANAGLELSLAAGVSGYAKLVSRFLNADHSPLRVAGRPASEFKQRVLSYVLSPNVDPAFDAMAAAGGTGQAYSTNSSQGLLQGLRAVFNPVLEQPSVFVAPTVGRAVATVFGNARDLYYPMFQPQASGQWSGNIKKLKLVNASHYDPVSGVESVVRNIVQAPLSAAPVGALDSIDGLLLRNALTFWTDPDGHDVQAYNSGRGEEPGSDGRAVKRGGAGQQIPGFLSGTVGMSNKEPDARQLFTQDPNDPESLMALDADMPDVTGISRILDPGRDLCETDVRQLIAWMRGRDTYDQDQDGDHSDTRPWLLGGVLHSQPLAVNYGARAAGYSAVNPDVRVFFGSNDGVLHALRNTQPSGRESGEESWAFIPLQQLPMQFARANGAADGASRYGMDGAPASLLVDRNRDGTIEPGDGDQAMVFVGQRRGGRNLYAFDVSDPDQIRLSWQINQHTSGFEQLGLTFSTPRVAHLDLGIGYLTPVLVFAGGYNGRGIQPGEGKDGAGGIDTVGNAVYVVDARSGELLWSALGPGSGAAAVAGRHSQRVPEMQHSIPSAVTLYDASGNGVVDRAYVGDTGGNVWRIDLTEHAAAPAGLMSPVQAIWSVSRLAALGGAAANDRRFFHPPDVVRTRDAGGRYDGIAIVSGNRAAPLSSAVLDVAYLLKDRVPANPVSPPAATPISQGKLVDITEYCDPATTLACEAIDLVDGWQLPLARSGEKGLSTPVLVNGVMSFTTYQPPGPPLTGQCQPGPGVSRAYAVKLSDGRPVESSWFTVEEGDEPPRSVETGEGIQGGIFPLDDALLFPGTGINEEQLLPLTGQRIWRAYWRENDVD